eukprot:3066705-Prymnesium_polylepis.1
MRFGASPRLRAVNEWTIEDPRIPLLYLLLDVCTFTYSVLAGTKLGVKRTRLSPRPNPVRPGTFGRVTGFRVKTENHVARSDAHVCAKYVLEVCRACVCFFVWLEWCAGVPHT